MSFSLHLHRETFIYVQIFIWPTTDAPQIILSSKLFYFNCSRKTGIDLHHTVVVKELISLNFNDFQTMKTHNFTSASGPFIS